MKSLLKLSNHATYVNVIDISRKLRIKRNRKNRKKVSVLAPKWPSISFIESFHSFKLRTVFRAKVFALVLHSPMNCTPRFHRFVPIRRLFCFTISATFALILRFIWSGWGRARRILLKMMIFFNVFLFSKNNYFLMKMDVLS